MEVRIERFVGMFKNAFSKEYCEGLIKAYDIAIEAGHGRTRQQDEDFTKLQKADTQLYNNVGNIQIPIPNITEFNEVFW